MRTITVKQAHKEATKMIQDGSVKTMAEACREVMKIRKVRSDKSKKIISSPLSLHAKFCNMRNEKPKAKKQSGVIQFPKFAKAVLECEEIPNEIKIAVMKLMWKEVGVE